MSYSGYNFVGWSTERDSGTVYQQDQDFRITEDTTLYAKWSKAGGNTGENNDNTEIAEPEKPENPPPSKEPETPGDPGPTVPGYEDNGNARTTAFISVIAWMAIAIAIFAYRQRDEDEEDRENR